MKRFKLLAVLAVAALALVLSTASANAGDELPFKVTTEVVRQSSEVNEGMVHLIYSGKANATHLGLAEAVAVVDIDLVTGIATGVVTLTKQDVDSITFEFVQVFDPALGGYVGEFQITGGSGKFEGAVGSGTLLNVPGDEPGTRVGEYDGTIIY
jgi:hypothetical protein